MLFFELWLNPSVPANVQFYLEKIVYDSPEMDIFAWRKQAAVIWGCMALGVPCVQQLLLKSINFYNMNFDL